ncbi:MAG: transcriptional repressor [Alphaproteobacteria bacterium]
MGRPSLLPVHPKQLTLRILKKSKKPMSAYDLLERLRSYGVNGAPVVYRALASLIKSGTVHKIHAQNTFIACNCDADHDHDLSVLTICQRCDRVEELHDHKIIHQLEGLRRKGVPLMRDAVIELPVYCQTCAA